MDYLISISNPIIPLTDHPGNAGTSPSSDKASQGTIFITDPDQIEKSNLSRQFLFRNKDIHTPKSITAAKAATSMNSHVNIIALEQKVESISSRLIFMI